MTLNPPYVDAETLAPYDRIAATLEVVCADSLHQMAANADDNGDCPACTGTGKRKLTGIADWLRVNGGEVLYRQTQVERSVEGYKIFHMPTYEPAITPLQLLDFAEEVMGWEWGKTYGAGYDEGSPIWYADGPDGQRLDAPVRRLLLRAIGAASEVRA